MFYPNFSRRTLAIVLSCLIIILGGVGLLFLIYIFNETSSLLSGPLEKVNPSNQPYKQSIIKSDEHKYDKKLKIQRTQEIKGNINRGNIYKNKNTYFPTPNESRVSSYSTNIVHNNKVQSTSLSTNEAKGTDVNLDTIYIDDFDRPTYNRKNQIDISNIDYFDVILVDHKVDKKLNNLNYTPHHNVEYKNVIFESINNKNNKRKKKKEKYVTQKTLAESHTKALLTTVVTSNKSIEDDSNILDSENTGSGSGDYTDDSELNEIYVQGAGKEELLQKGKIKKQRRWKHPYQLFENDSKSPSSKSHITTSIANRSYLKDLANGRSSSNLSSYPTVSSQFVDKKKTDQVPKETHKKPLPPNTSTRHSDLFYNNSYPIPSTFQKNDLDDQLRITGFGSRVDGQVIDNTPAKLRGNDIDENDESWIETRTRRIMGNVKKSEERSRQLLLCEEAGGGELCRMLFKEDVSD